MQTISKQSDKCKKCSNVNNCDKKRMVSCTIQEYEANTTYNTIPKGISFAQNMSRLNNKVKINMGEYGTINTSLEEIQEKLKRNLYKNINCSFNK